MVAGVLSGLQISICFVKRLVMGRAATCALWVTWLEARAQGDMVSRVHSLSLRRAIFQRLDNCCDINA